MLQLKSFAILLTLGTLLTASFGCATRPTQEECELMLERYVDLLIASDRPNINATERARIKLETRAKARRDPSFQRCSDQVNRQQLECALTANTADRVEQCLL